MGETANTYVELSHPPTSPALDICGDLACKPIGCHMKLFSQPPFSHSIYPWDYHVLCCPIPGSTFVVQEDQVVDGVSVKQRTYTVIYDDCVWESEEEPT